MVSPLSQFFRSYWAANGVSSAVALQPGCHHEQSSVEYCHLALGRRVFPVGARRFLLPSGIYWRVCNGECFLCDCDCDPSRPAALQLEGVLHFFRDCLHGEQYLRESEHPNGLPIWTLPLHGRARPQAFSRAVTHCPRVFWMRLPGLVARTCFRWRLGKQTPRRPNLACAYSRGLRHGHVGSNDGSYRGDCSETVDMA